MIRPPGIPHVTVVVPTVLARGEEVTRCLRSLLDQTYPAFDVLVVDNRPVGAPDRRALVPSHPRLAVLHEPSPGISAARNLGLAHATGDIVAFTDDDVVTDPEWLVAVVARFTTQPDVDVVTGLIEPGVQSTDAQAWFEEFYGGFGSPRTYRRLTYRLAGTGEPGGRGRRRAVVAEFDDSPGHGPDGGTPVRRFSLFGAGVVGAGANMAFRTARLRALGGFDTRLGTGTPARGGEDLDVFVRALWDGAVIGYEPGAVVAHTHRADVAGLRRQLRGYGIGFTAMLTAVVTREPRLLLCLLGQVPHALRVRAAEISGRLHRSRAVPVATVPADGVPADPADPAVPAGAVPAEAVPAYPPDLVRAEAVGWLLGPPSFLVSALRRR